MKSLQAQHRSSQKKTVITALCPHFLAFNNQDAVESHMVSYFPTQSSLMDVIYCSRTVFREGKTRSGIFQFFSFRLKGTMNVLPKKAVRVNAEACFQGEYECIILQNQGFVFCSLISGSAWEQKEFCNSQSQNISFRHWDCLSSV